MTLDDKIDEFNELIDRRKKINSFFHRQKNYEMSIKIDVKFFPIEIEDIELKKIIDDYYKKELEKVDKKLNELLK